MLSLSGHELIFDLRADMKQLKGLFNLVTKRVSGLDWADFVRDDGWGSGYD